MTLRPRTLFLPAIVAVICSVQFAAGKKPKNPPAASIDQHAQVLHALNRLTFGPRAGDVERVSAMGLQNWIDQQLHPEKIDDRALEARLAPFRTLRMDNRELFDNFPTQELIKEVAEGKLSMPSDPMQRAIYRAQLERYQKKKEKKDNGVVDKISTQSPDSAVDREELLDLAPDQRMREFLKLSPDQQRALLANAKSERVEEFLQGLDPKQRETVMGIENPQQVVTSELIQAKLLRSIYSERQLEDVMTDFWLNHFNVFIGKGADRYLLTSYERDVIRPHALGKFEDLLVATARSPAMLFYLDNWMSVGPDSDFANGTRERVGGRGRLKRVRVHPAKAGKDKHRGLNENYGRELMELHTLGVNGGYTQKDVTEVARVFTGWTLKKPREGGDFTFDARMHEPGDKKVLGRRVKENGEKEGLEVLHLLARHPSTAKFISTKLAMRFVSDDPPPALVQRMSETFLKKKGAIREVLQTMLESPEFWSAEAYRAKVKTPLEFVVSSLRACGADVTDAAPLARQLQNLGMPLYGMQPPTGYSTKADAWVNSAALLGRMNFALSLSAGKVKGVQMETANILSNNQASLSPQDSLAILENKLLLGNISQQTHETILAQLQNTKPKKASTGNHDEVGMIQGLLLGSPEFQRR
jgi:uncharacterized protein (DUF1800 family)